MWAAPARPNGPLTQYQLRQLGLVDNDTVSLASSVKTYTVTSLGIYTNYSFEVRACNKVGCSRPSPAMAGRTLPGRPSRMEPPRTQLLSVSAVRVRWSEPRVASGPDHTYQLRIVSEREGVNTTSIQTLPQTDAAGEPAPTLRPAVARIAAVGSAVNPGPVPLIPSIYH